MTIHIWGGNHSQGLHNNFLTITKAKQTALEFLWQVTAVKFWEHFSDQIAKKYLSMNIFFWFDAGKEIHLAKRFSEGRHLSFGYVI